jgi:hypothetical protein
MGKVHVGMEVLDADGAAVGTVAHVVFGDEEAAEHAPFGRMAVRLISGGYLIVADPDQPGVDHYIPPEEISEVEDETVFLRVGRDDLVAEQ